MCDLIPADVWNDIDSTFLEPACGNGNFLVEIFSRKLKKCKTRDEAIRALKSIYGIDIQSDNCDESKRRLRKLFTDKFEYSSDIETTLNNNIICGDSLEIMKKWEIKQNEM